MANFGSEFSALFFPGFQATQKIHAQNSRPELSAFLPRTEPLFANRASGQLENVSRRFEAIRADCSYIMKIVGRRAKF